ncbi:MAG: PKD domain-containing protein [Gemmatimonadota bacterium]
MTGVPPTRHRLVPVALVTLLTVIGLASCAEQPVAPDGATFAPDAPALARQAADPFVEGRVLARFTPGANGAAIASSVGAKIERDLVLGIRVLNVPAGRELALAEALARNPNVEFAEPDYLRTFGDPAVMPVNDPHIGYKWDLDNDGNIYDGQGNVVTSTGKADADMDWREAVESLPSSNGSARIGIMDTGIRADHEELTGRIAAQYDFFAGDSNAADDNGHGTHVAGIAAAATDNGVGVAGVAYTGNVQFVIAKVCGPSNRGPFSSYGCPLSAIADGIVWAVDNGAHVLNLSLGGGSGSDTEQSALQYARANNVLPFCATGNDNGPVSYPAAFPECVAVGATDWGDNRASYSNYGPEIDISAPGGDDEDPDGYSYILSSYYDSPTSYMFMAGTSMATPQATGLGALLHVLGVTDDDAKLSNMKSTADDLGASGWDQYSGAGRINVAAAVSAASGGDTNSPPTASFTYSCTDLSCTFDGTGSSDSDGSIASYDWDFGDGNDGSGSTVSHTYAAGGTYTVTLTVTDNDGATGSDAQDVSVSDGTVNSPPSADFTYSASDLTVDFTDQSSDSDGTIDSWAWDFGDGATSTAQNPSHTYGAGGTYTVTLTVTDDDGATDNESQSVTVSSSTTNSPPTASFTFTTSDLTADFTDQSSDTDGTIDSWAWDFGDGATSADQNPTHTYASGGTYTVTLTVTDDDGATDSASQDVTVTAPSTGITLSVYAYKVRGVQHADLTWSGATSTNVDVYRDGAVVATTANDGAYTDSTGQKGGGSAVYKVCEAGTTTCSNEVTVTW